MRHSRLHRRYGRAAKPLRLIPGTTFRYVGPNPKLGGMEGVVVITGDRDALVHWATHQSAIYQRGTAAHWSPERLPLEDLKPIKKLTKGFAMYHREGEAWVKDVSI
jgi:hypothetical protein